jgi:hypothetical protein
MNEFYYIIYIFYFVTIFSSLRFLAYRRFIQLIWKQTGRGNRKVGYELVVICFLDLKCNVLSFKILDFLNRICNSFINVYVRYFIYI